MADQNNQNVQGLELAIETIRSIMPDKERGNRSNHGPYQRMIEALEEKIQEAGGVDAGLPTADDVRGILKEPKKQQGNPVGAMTTEGATVAADTGKPDKAAKDAQKAEKKAGRDRDRQRQEPVT